MRIAKVATSKCTGAVGFTHCDGTGSGLLAPTATIMGTTTASSCPTTAASEKAAANQIAIDIGAPKNSVTIVACKKANLACAKSAGRRLSSQVQLDYAAVVTASTSA